MIELDIKNGANRIGKCKKQGSIEWKFPTMFKYGSAPPPPPRVLATGRAPMFIIDIYFNKPHVR